MGSASSACAPGDEETKNSKRIEAMLADEKRTRSRDKEHSLLLLGISESGKSTVFKQMKVLQDNGGFSKEELAAYRSVIVSKMFFLCKYFLLQLDPKGRKVAEQNKEAAKVVLTQEGLTPMMWPSGTREALKEVWKDEAVKALIAERGMLGVDDSIDYFYKHVDRILAEEYTPNEDDVIRVRIRTTGCEEARFKFGGIGFRMIDVGGQRSERRKWINHFDCVTSVVFCIALSDYDLTLREDPMANRMKESLSLYEEISDGPWFQEIPFMVFLNKTDIFREKIQILDMSCTFPDYKGGRNYESGVAFIEKYLEKISNKRKIYVHQTCAVDRENMKFVFTAVREILVKGVMQDIIG